MTIAPNPGSAEVVYARMRWNAPLSQEHADLLLERLEITTAREFVDLGCGWGELLLQALAQVPGARGVGVDNEPSLLERGRALSEARDLSTRAFFAAGDAAAWEEVADRVLCVGASHAWGGSARALRALRSVVRPRGRLLFGDGCWEHPPPSPAAAATFGGEVLALGELVDQAIAAGWRVHHLSTADQREWDDFEASWRAGRQAWLLSYPDDDRAQEVMDTVDGQLREYVGVYRGVLGFAFLVLIA